MFFQHQGVAPLLKYQRASLCLVISLAGCSASSDQPTTREPNAPVMYAPDTRRDPRAIESVLWQDQMATQQGKMFQDAGRGAAVAAGWMVDRMKAIDTSSCPTEFRVAYLKHVQAWQEMTEQLRKEPREKAERLFAFTFKAVVARNPDFSLLHGSDSHKQCAEAVHDTWKEVELVAVQVGARLQ